MAIDLRTGCPCQIRNYLEEEDIAKITRSHKGARIRSITEDLCNVKRKVISDICNVLKQLECGIQPDLEMILEQISLVEIESFSEEDIPPIPINPPKMKYATYYGSSNQSQINSIDGLSSTNEMSFSDTINKQYYYIVTSYGLKSVETPFESLLDDTNPNRFKNIGTLQVKGKTYNVWQFTLDSGLVFNQNISVTLQK